MDAFEWTDPKQDAAELLADGKLSDAAIAGQVGCDRKTLWRWRQHSEFQARINEHIEEYRAEVRRRGIAVREHRVKALNDRWNRLQRVIRARASDPDLADVSGGSTGLLVKTTRTRGTGVDLEMIVEAEVDTGLLKELREHEKQAAQELGQWVEKQETKSESSHSVIHALAEDLDRSYHEPGDDSDADDLDEV